MNIALFHTTLPEPGRKPGGVEVAVHRLASSLCRPPHEVTVFSLTPPPDEAPYRHVMLFARQPWLRRHKLARLFVLPLLLNSVDFRRFDVLHLHGDDWFFVRRPFATLRTLHGSALEEARSATSWRRRLLQYGVYPLEHLSVRLATLPLGVGPRTGALYGIDDLADNGVDLDLFHPGAKTEAPSVLFVGTWEGRKRGRFLFETFTRHVLPCMPEARLYMVADECPEHDGVVRVRFPDDEALAQLYRQAWVFAYPSVYEGFGIPYLEALASGTAVLCSPNDGAAYVLRDGTYGLVADDEGFGDQLVGILRNERVRHAFEAKGIEHARRYSWDAVATQHLQAYRRAQARWLGLPQPVLTTERS